MGLRASWDFVVAWCRENAPVTAAALRPPAPAAELIETQTLFPFPWAEELQEWFRLQDGIEPGPLLSDGPLPGWSTCSLADVRENSTRLSEYAEMWDDPDLVIKEGRRAAGKSAPFWLPSFVSIGINVATEYLYVDTRLGPRSGCVADWHVADGTGSQRWPSLEQLISGTARSMRKQTAYRGLVPEVEDGALVWQAADDPQREKVEPPHPAWADFCEKLRNHRIKVWNDNGQTWSDGISDEARFTEQRATSTRSMIVDVIQSVLRGEPADAWDGGRSRWLELSKDQLKDLKPLLTSDLSRQRVDEVEELAMEFERLCRDHPI